MFLLILLTVLMVYGISNIIVFGSIFEGLRNFLLKYIPFLGKLVTCMMCTSFWVGVLLGIYIMVNVGLVITIYSVIPLIMIGGLYSGSIWLIHTIQEYFEK